MISQLDLLRNIAEYFEEYHPSCPWETIVTLKCLEYVQKVNPDRGHRVDDFSFAYDVYVRGQLSSGDILTVLNQRIEELEKICQASSDQ